MTGNIIDLKAAQSLGEPHKALFTLRLLDQFGDLGRWPDGFNHDDVLPVEVHAVWPVEFLPSPYENVFRFFGRWIYAALNVINVRQNGMSSAKSR
jgi:hypothetical protein